MTPPRHFASLKAVCVLFWFAPAIAIAGPLNVNSAQHYLNPENIKQTDFGKLIYVSGIVLKSDNAEFGGYSGLLVSADGKRLLAVSDKGHLLSATLIYKDGKLDGVAGAEISPLLDEAGRSLVQKGNADSESLTAERPGDLSGPVYVSFERNHRVLRYGSLTSGNNARPELLAMPSMLRNAPSNGGVEAFERRKDGTMIALTEQWLDDAGNHIGWMIGPDGSEEIRLRTQGLFHPTDLEFLPNGDLLILERRFTLAGGPGMQIRRIKAATIQPGAILDGEVLINLTAKYGIDNMEGLAMHQNATGGTELLIISDDNFSRLQKTVLLQFLLPPD